KGGETFQFRQAFGEFLKRSSRVLRSPERHEFHAACARGRFYVQDIKNNGPMATLLQLAAHCCEPGDVAGPRRTDQSKVSHSKPERRVPDRAGTGTRFSTNLMSGLRNSFTRLSIDDVRQKE